VKDDISPHPVPPKLTPNQEQIAVEITGILSLRGSPRRRPRGGILRKRSEYSRRVVLNKVRACIDTLTHGLPVAKKFFDRRENKAHAKKLIEATNTLKQLIETAPESLAWSFFPYPDDSFYPQLDHIQKVCTRTAWNYDFIGPKFGHHHRYNLAAHWCAEFGAKLMQEVAPRARIASADHRSVFRQVTGLLYGAVKGMDLERARGVDLERACDEAVKKLGQ
jgi:hypothetical protein